MPDHGGPDRDHEYQRHAQQSQVVVDVINKIIDILEQTRDRHPHEGGSSAGGSSAGVILESTTWNGNITNNGTILGANVGVAIGYNPFNGKAAGETFKGDITNNFSITGSTTGLKIVLDKFTGNFTNTGVIAGGQFGVYVDVDTYVGNFDNTASGVIDPSLGGEGSAVRIGSAATGAASDQTFTGNISNEGLINGAHDGLVIVLNSYDGSAGTGFTNSGSIVGASHRGVSIDVGSWKGNITNAAGGFIEGGVTGFFVNAGTITGDFTNNGTIIGHGFDTGLNIQTPSYTGNIANGVAGVISAPSLTQKRQKLAFIVTSPLTLHAVTRTRVAESPDMVAAGDHNVLFSSSESPFRKKLCWNGSRNMLSTAC